MMRNTRQALHVLSFLTLLTLAAGARNTSVLAAPPDKTGSALAKPLHSAFGTERSSALSKKKRNKYVKPFTTFKKERMAAMRSSNAFNTFTPGVLSLREADRIEEEKRAKRRAQQRQRLERQRRDLWKRG